jgi:hypothetical protein
LFGAGCWAQDPVSSSIPISNEEVSAGQSSAQSDPDDNQEWGSSEAQSHSSGFACSMTGAGEQICKTLLARTCADVFLQNDSLSAQDAAEYVLDSKFLKSPLLRSYPERHAGFIAVRVEVESSPSTTTSSQGLPLSSPLKPPEPHRPLLAEFVIAHTTRTMVIGYELNTNELCSVVWILQF